MQKKCTSSAEKWKKYGGRILKIHKFDYIDKWMQYGITP